jgi:hypothetical protein
LRLISNIPAPQLPRKTRIKWQQDAPDLSLSFVNVRISGKLGSKDWPSKSTTQTELLKIMGVPGKYYLSLSFVNVRISGKRGSKLLVTHICMCDFSLVCSYLLKKQIERNHWEAFLPHREDINVLNLCVNYFFLTLFNLLVFTWLCRRP